MLTVSKQGLPECSIGYTVAMHSPVQGEDLLSTAFRNVGSGAANNVHLQTLPFGIHAHIKSGECYVT